jgi:hypothetical protein
VEELLELFYPVHYRSGIAFEDAMHGGQLTRKQTAILWLIRFEGEQGRHGWPESGPRARPQGRQGRAN